MIIRMAYPMIVGLCVMIGWCASQSVQAAESSAKADYLRCEYRVAPLGIGVVEPCLS